MKRKPAKVEETAAPYPAKKPAKTGKDWQRLIAVDPAVLTGKPVVKGTRLAVEFVLGLLAQGWSEAEIIRNYPGLTQAQILACVAYAQARFSDDDMMPTATHVTELDLDAEEIALHAAVSAAVAQDLGR